MQGELSELAGSVHGTYEWIVSYDKIKDFLTPSFLHTSFEVPVDYSLSIPITIHLPAGQSPIVEPLPSPSIEYFTPCVRASLAPSWSDPEVATGRAS